MDKAKRLNNIFGKDGKTIIVALDGFGFSANTDGVDFSVKSVHQLLKYGLNCALVTYGQAQLFAQDLLDVPTILRVDGSVNVFDSSVPETAQFFDVTDALKLGASGVVCMTFPGSQGGREEFSHKMLARLAKQGEEWNVPVIAETLPCSYAVSEQEPNSDNPDYIKTAARLGVEYVHNLMTAGVCGIATGRNITQDPNPVGKVAALSAIVHDGKTVEEALQIYSTTKS